MELIPEDFSKVFLKIGLVMNPGRMAAVRNNAQEGRVSQFYFFYSRFFQYFKPFICYRCS